MAILTYSEYCDFKTGTDIDESEFDTLLFFAETAVMSYILTDYKPNEDIKRATALQIAMSKRSGGASYYTDISSVITVTSESLGDYSYSGRLTDNAAQRESGLFPVVAGMLKGYRIRAVNVRL